MSDISLTLKFPDMSKRKIAIGLLFLLILTAAIVSYSLYRHYKNQHDDAAAISAIVGTPITSFTPYYFTGTIPGNYSVNKTASQYSNDILQITLAKPDGTSVVLNEQALPDKLNPNNLLANTTSVKGTVGQAGFATVEGRIVGTLLPYNHKTLVIITAPGTANTGDIAVLMQSLQAVR